MKQALLEPERRVIERALRHCGGNREKAAKGIYPNVDFYSATTYHCIGLPLDLFTPMFVLSRVGGWSAHVIEQLSDNRLFRPDVDYKGPHEAPYVAMEQR